MLISRAFATNGTLSTGSSGGATALSIIIAVAIAFLVIYVGHKKWRRRRLGRDADNKEFVDQ